MYQLVRSIMHDEARHERLDTDSSVTGMSLKVAVATATKLLGDQILNGCDVAYGDSDKAVPIRWSVHHEGLFPRTVYFEVQKVRKQDDPEKIMALLDAKARPTWKQVAP